MASPEERVLAAVEELGLPYEVITIDPEFADTAAFGGKYGYPLDRSCNSIIVASKKEPKKYAVCVVLASTRLDVNKQVTRRARYGEGVFVNTIAAMHACGGRTECDLRRRAASLPR